MLVLSRRLQERILLPAVNVVIQVVGIRPGMVRLGIEAPADINIVREEVQGLPVREPVRDRTPHPSDHGKGIRGLDHFLEAISARLGLARIELLAGQTDKVPVLLDTIQNEVFQLRQQLARDRRKAQPPAPPRPRNTVPCRKAPCGQ